MLRREREDQLRFAARAAKAAQLNVDASLEAAATKLAAVDIACSHCGRGVKTQWMVATGHEVAANPEPHRRPPGKRPPTADANAPQPLQSRIPGHGLAPRHRRGARVAAKAEDG